MIGIAVRHSLLPDDHMTFIDSMEKIGLFENCARKLATNSPNVAFFIMSDRLETKVHFVQKFGSRAVAIDSPIEHSAFGSKASFLYTLAEDCNSQWILSCLRCICPCSHQKNELDRALLWFLFADVDDAVITKMSTFGLTAFARTGRASACDHDGLAFRHRRSISVYGAGAPPQSTRVESATSSAEMPISIDPLKEPSYYTSKATQCVRQAWNFDIDEWGSAGKSSFQLFFLWILILVHYACTPSKNHRRATIVSGRHLMLLGAMSHIELQVDHSATHSAVRRQTGALLLLPQRDGRASPPVA